jgi:aminopeptidase N
MQYYRLKTISLVLVFSFIHLIAIAQYTNQDSLRGSIGIGRQHWDITHYDITVTPNIEKKSISGKNIITLIDSGINLIQIDLQQPMELDSIFLEGKPCLFKRNGNVLWIEVGSNKNTKPNIKKLTCYFHGTPKEAVHPPWDGGWIWKKDALNNPFVSVACQGLGASVWFPCKDTQSDEPENGCTLTIIVPDSLVAVGNGHLVDQKKMSNNLMSFTWQVKSPINNYNIVSYIGKYKHFSEIYKGLNGPLNMDYWVLEQNIDKAKLQFKDAPRMMKAFEYWFGTYPFYEDGYKLVEAPHLGMEHQSAIAYGNEFTNGYLGSDLSSTGWGLKWDFIIVHESGHEWFANNITSKDIADMWIHESFTTYSETLFTEYYYGKKAANTYIQGLRSSIQNDKPIIGKYGVNNEGSGDMYNKGGNMIHTIRQVINNDKKFREILIGLNKTFYHKTVTTKEIENYISNKSEFDFSTIFDQYLSTIEIPVLEYYFDSNQLHYRFRHTVSNFNMPVRYRFNEKSTYKWITVSNEWKQIKVGNSSSSNFIVDPNFYINLKEVPAFHF